MTDKKKTITFEEIFQRPVWTKKMIRENLDSCEKQQGLRKGINMQTEYLLNDVEKFEQTDSFKDKAFMQRKDFLTYTDLLSRPGWTKKQVETLLGEPDRLKSNPSFPASASIRLYTPESVEAAEKTEEFTSRFDEIESHRKKMMDTVQKRIKKSITDTIDKILTLNLMIEIVPWEKLMERTRRKYQKNLNNQRSEKYKDCYFGIDEACDMNLGIEEFDRRDAVNYIRHELFDYKGVKSAFNYDEKSEEPRALHIYLYYKIAKTYHVTQDECLNQLLMRGCDIKPEQWNSLFTPECDVNATLKNIMLSQYPNMSFSKPDAEPMQAQDCENTMMKFKI